ncbi:MAG TPA: cytochrome c-type biogenesis protein [Stellaceae bacterium]|nr:cytochrome c-type biogenesis protein [Stellaceae bacterium]
MRALLAFMLLAWTTAAALAVEPGERLDDPALEARARAISAGLRCLVCQNQSLDDSNAELAHDLRVLIRERLKAGDSDEQVRQFLVRRYGEFILLKPPLEPETYLLWFGPFGVLLLGAAGVAFYLRRRGRTPATEPPPLTPEERRKLAKLLAEDR